ncbi:MAG: hypothetical protein UT48_C0008G0022 [Parcubacteria group bacterium GW2011_GWE2_39_37]|uniref:Uncharacterized protein n=1 Tax=Candidatus Falkowbacteria bacterium GW2011_GWF2_39_8 TaxID=1618642 RepID=A0A0G0PTY9_9BACT|nr:MAG: hypothetical protein UT48_C0008G0022 [Parcubacteria group bacterium GW2011_GWE2_39_37]KKR31378.1 MAG: hypothetical protein UT64_C0062G0009 [Candidatus Falkowbacteria bacterium GW2011_GWF2_39_8]
MANVKKFFIYVYILTLIQLNFKSKKIADLMVGYRKC